MTHPAEPAPTTSVCIESAGYIEVARLVPIGQDLPMLLTKDLVRWQWQAYPVAHRDRRNLAIHAITNPIFVGGVLSLGTGAATLSWPLAVGGLGAMAGAMIAQGRGHKMEAEPPAPFASPLDVVARIFVEQLFTFPRFVLSGRFAEAWRSATVR